MATAAKRVQLKITYAHPDTQPPVYLAGAFSDPQWQPQEMQYTTDEHNQHQFYKEIEVEQGACYEYKFRLGPGDWWVLDEESDTVTDGAGNRNNVLRVAAEEVVEEKKQEDSNDAVFLSLTEKDEPVVETAEVHSVEVPEAHEPQTHEHSEPSLATTEQDSTFLKQLDGNTEKEHTGDHKIIVPESTSEADTAEIEDVADQPQATDPLDVVKEEITPIPDGKVKQLDESTRSDSAVHTDTVTDGGNAEKATIHDQATKISDMGRECPVPTHDSEHDTHVRQFDGTGAVEEGARDAGFLEKEKQQPSSTEVAQTTADRAQADTVKSGTIEAITDNNNEKSDRETNPLSTAQDTRKDSVINVDNVTEKSTSAIESGDLAAAKEDEPAAETLPDATTSEPESEDTKITAKSPSRDLEKSTIKPPPAGAAAKDEKGQETIISSVTRSNAPSIIDLPPRDARVKSRSPSPGQLFSKAHLLRLQEKNKSPPIKEDVKGQDYLEESSPVFRPSSTSSTSEEKVENATSSPELPHTPPMSRRTSSKTKQIPRPAILSEAGGRSISDGLPTSKERVFPLKRQQSEGASGPEVSEKLIDSVLTETNTFDGTSLPVAVCQQNFHKDWSPLDWNPEAKAKYEEQQSRLEKIRRPLNHYYDAEKSAHRDLLNSKRGQTLHNLYNHRQAKSNVATQETKDMWKYIRHLREEKRYRTSKTPHNVPLTWVFHLDEPQHPRYTPEALDEHIHVVEDEIAFYAHREKVEAGTGGDRPNSWYSPASFDFVAEHRYLGSANGSSRRSKNGSERGRKSSSEYAATWKQKQAQIIAKRGDIFSRSDNPQLDQLTRLEATGVETNDPASEAPSADWAQSLNQRLGDVIDSESDQDSSGQSRKQSSSSQGSGSSKAEPSNLTPLHVGNRQLGDEQRTLRAEGNGPQINLHPATPAPPSKDTEDDNKQLAHSTNDSKDKLKTSNTHKRNVSERSITPSSLHTAGHDSKHSKNVFRTFLRFVFVEFWRGLFQKLSRFGKGPANA